MNHAPFHHILLASIEGINFAIFEKENLHKLTPVELVAYQKRNNTRQKIQFLMTRMMVKNWFFQHHKQPPHLVEIRYDNNALASLKKHTGKPLLHLINNHNQLPAILPASFEISISHSDDYIVCGLSDSGDKTGIDIEHINSERNMDGLINQYFSEMEKQAINESVDKTLTFYRLWCIKESLFKAHNRAFPHRLFFSFDEHGLVDPKSRSLMIEFENNPYHVHFPELIDINSSNINRHYCCTYVVKCKNNQNKTYRHSTHPIVSSFSF